MQERWFLNQCVKPMSSVSHQIIWSDLKHCMFSANRQMEACVRVRTCASDTVVRWHGLCDILQSFAGVNDEWVQTLQLGTHEHVRTQKLQNVYRSEMHTCKHMYHESPWSEHLFNTRKHICKAEDPSEKYFLWKKLDPLTWWMNTVSQNLDRVGFILILFKACKHTLITSVISGPEVLICFTKSKSKFFTEKRSKWLHTVYRIFSDAGWILFDIARTWPCNRAAEKTASLW